MRTREHLALAVLLAGAAALRWTAWERSAVLFNDGPRFLAITEAFEAGAWRTALLDAFHPLYPLAVAAVHASLPGLSREDAAVLVSVAGGTAAVGFVFAFVREAFGARAGWGAALLLAVQSRTVEYASDVQSDGLYLGLFAGGLWSGWRALERRSPAWAAAAGVASGLAYLTRPEGLGLAVVLLAVAALGALGLDRGAGARDPARVSASPAQASSGRPERAPGAALRWVAALVAAAGVASAPYWIGLHQAGAGPALTRKKSTLAMLGGEAPAAPVGQAIAGPRALPEAALLDPARALEDGERVRRAPTRAARVFEAVRMTGRTLRSSLRYGVFALVVVGLLAEAGRPGRRGLFAGAFALAYAGLLVALAASAGYVSRRHALPALLPLFGYAALGADAAGRALAAALRSIAPSAAPAALGGVLGALLLGGVATAEALRSLEPRRVEERAARDAAEWLSAHASGPGLLAVPRDRLGYYARMPYVSIAGIAETGLGGYLARTGARYVIVDEPAQARAIESAREIEVRTLHRLDREHRSAWVLELRPVADPAR